MFRIIRQPLFNIEGGGGEPPAPVNPLRAEPTPTEPTTPVIPITVEPVVEEVDFGGRKLKVSDPAIKDLHGDWTQLSGTLTKEQQRAKQLEIELSQVRQALEVAQKQPEPTREADPERIKEINETYQEMVYEDPLGAMVWLNQQPEYQQLIKPVYEQNVQSVMSQSQEKDMQLKTQIKQQGELLTMKHSDFKDLLPQMDQVVSQYPHLREQMESNPTVELMETIYFTAKGLHGNQATSVSQTEPVAAPVVELPVTQPTVAELLQNPEFVQKILQDEQVKNTIVKNYLDGVNHTQNQVPLSMGNTPGGTTPSLPEFSPKNLKEGTKGLKSWMRSLGQ